MAKNFNIIQFEADDFYSTTLDLVFYNMGLEPPIKVTGKDEARDIIKKIENREIKPDVAIVDTFIGINNEDGEKIAKKLREISPSTKIIGYSVMETSDWADFQAIKTSDEAGKTLIQVLEEALDVKFNYSDTEDPEYVPNDEI